MKEKNIRIKIDNKYVIIGVCIIAIILIVLLFNFISNLIYASKYDEYKVKMDSYGLSNLYTNKSSNSSDSLTKIDALKVVIGSIAKIEDISEYMIDASKNENENWVKYAVDFGIVEEDEVSNGNYNQLAKYYELVSYIYKAQKLYTDIDTSQEKINVIKDEKNYSESISKCFSDYVQSGVITKYTSNIDANKTAVKGEANEIIINLYEKFNLITLNNEKLKLENLPKNFNEYTYVIDSFKNEAYENKYIKKDENNFKNSKEVYLDKKSQYLNIKEIAEKYAGAIFNIDYTNIKYEKLRNTLNKYTNIDGENEALKRYCDYVVKNKIKLKSDVKFVEPCFYFDGQKYRARMQIDLKIESASVKENLLFGDLELNENYEYKDEKYTLYVDICFNNVSGDKLAYVDKISYIRDDIVNKENLNIVSKSK